MKKIHLLTIVALIMVVLLGCEKAKIQNQATADVFVKAIKNSQGATVYAIVHSVFSYNVMTGVSVKSPSGATMQLTNFENGGNSFFNQTTDADYLPVPPAVGNYVYSVKFTDGEELSYTNSLSSSVIEPANITSLAKSANGDSIYIKWDAILNTHAYQIKVMKGTTQVFNQPAFADVSVPLKQNLRMGWYLANLNSSGPGTYTFELDGLLFESSSYDYIQAISTSTKNISL